MARAADKLTEADDPDIAVVRSGMLAWLEGDAPSLDAAMGVARAPCQRDVRKRLALDRRNEAVRVAFRQWGNVDDLVQALARYQAGAWIRDRLERECPARLAARPERFLWAILRERDRELSRTAIYAILKAP